MEKEIIEMISEITGIDPKSISMDSNLVSDLKLESLDLVMLVAEAEKKLNIVIPDSEIKDIQTVKDVVTVISKLTNE